jgi:hypothetical protein
MLIIQNLKVSAPDDLRLSPITDACRRRFEPGTRGVKGLISVAVNAKHPSRRLYRPRVSEIAFSALASLDIARQGKDTREGYCRPRRSYIVSS